MDYDIAAQGDSFDDLKDRFAWTFIGNIILNLSKNKEPLAGFFAAPTKYQNMWKNAVPVGETLPLTIPRDMLPKNVLPFPERVPHGEIKFGLAA